MAPRSSRSRDTVAWVAATPSAASRSTSWAWLVTAWSASSRATRCWRCGLGQRAGRPGHGPRTGHDPVGLLEQPRQQAPEAVQAVVGLGDHPALRPVDHRRRHLLAPVGGQAVHEHRVGRGGRHDPVVDLEALERPGPGLGLGLLAHRRPHVGVHGVGAGHGLVRAGWSRPARRPAPGAGRGRRRRARSPAGRPAAPSCPASWRRGPASGPRC